MTDFLTASEARANATNKTTVLTEINAIELEILNQSDAGSFSATVGPGTTPSPIATTLTASATAFDAWNDPVSNQTDAHNVAREQMTQVIQYFNKKNYSIKRVQEGVTSTFNWVVTW